MENKGNMDYNNGLRIIAILLSVMVVIAVSVAVITVKNVNRLREFCTQETTLLDESANEEIQQ